MTKKTDSLIFRYGIQTLWKNTNFLFKSSVSSNFFFKFLQFELYKNNFELLFVDYKKFNLVYAFVFCFFWKASTNRVKKTHISLLYNILNFYKYWFLVQVLFILFNFINTLRVSFVIIHPLLSLVQFTRVFFFKYDYNYFGTSQKFETLFFKAEELRLEHSFSTFFNRQFYLKLHNVFSLPLYFDFIQLAKSQFGSNALSTNLNNLEFMLYLSCKLRLIGIFTRYLAKNLASENKHRRLLWQVVNSIKRLRGHVALFKGLRIYVTGKLNGKMRRKTYSFKTGELAVQQLNTNLDYFKSTSFTKFGVLSIKVWIFFKYTYEKNI